MSSPFHAILRSTSLRSALLRGALCCSLLSTTRCGESASPSSDLAVLKRASVDRAKVSDDDLQRVLTSIAARAGTPAVLDAETLDLVIALSSDSKEEIRFSTIGALVPLPDPRAVAALQRMAAADSSELVREEAKSALATKPEGSVK